jgi:hypothetical protein
MGSRLKFKRRDAQLSFDMCSPIASQSILPSKNTPSIECAQLRAENAILKTRLELAQSAFRDLFHLSIGSLYRRWFWIHRDRKGERSYRRIAGEIEIASLEKLCEMLYRKGG